MSTSLAEIFEKYKDDLYLTYFNILNSCVGSLNNPCYAPPISTRIKDILGPVVRHINDEDNFNVEKYIRDNYIDKTFNGRLLNDSTVWFYILNSVYFNSKPVQDTIDKDITFLSSYIIYLKYYTSLIKKHMPKVCDKVKAELALSLLSEKSLFSINNKRMLQYSQSILNSYSLNGKIKTSIKSSTIALGMVYLYDVIKDSYLVKVKDISDSKSISKTIMAMRDRLSQSFKAYANLYYKVIENNIRTDVEEESTILNYINRVISLSTSSMLYIPDNHYKTIVKFTEVSEKYLYIMYNCAFKDKDNVNDNTPDIINIILKENINILESTNDISNWLSEVTKTIAIRNRYNIRELLMNIIRSNDELFQLFESKSLSFKHKMIQAQGLVIGLVTFDALKQHLLGSIKRIYVI